MTDRAARKRRTTTTMPPVEPTPQKPAVNEGAPPVGHPAADATGDSAPYQLPDGTWEVLTLDADGRVTGRRTVEGPK